METWQIGMLLWRLACCCCFTSSVAATASARTRRSRPVRNRAVDDRGDGGSVGGSLRVRRRGRLPTASSSRAHRAVDLGGPRLVSSRESKAKDPLKGESISNVASRSIGLDVGGRNRRIPTLRDALFSVLLAPTAGSPPAGGARLSRHRHLRHCVRLPGREPDVERSGPGSARRHGPAVARLGTARAAVCSHAYQAVSLAPDWPVAQNTLGTLLFKLGHRADARSAIRDRRAARCRRRLCAGQPLHPDAGRGPDAGGDHGLPPGEGRASGPRIRQHLSGVPLMPASVTHIGSHSPVSRGAALAGGDRSARSTCSSSWS